MGTSLSMMANSGLQVTKKAAGLSGIIVGLKEIPCLKNIPNSTSYFRLYILNVKT